MLSLPDLLQRDWPVSQWLQLKQVVAVSGGADSVALLRAMVDLAPNRHVLVAAHFNHGWRGAESDADEAFVRDFCHSLGVPLILGRAERVLTPGCQSMPAEATSNQIGTPNQTGTPNQIGTPNQTGTPQSEESARKLRYQFLTKVATQVGARHILTAHTASDRVETMLHHLCRGTGLAGVCTPKLLHTLRSGFHLVRPLIGCFRDLIEAYLAELQQPYRIDSSNQDFSYRRNDIRANLLPWLRQSYGPEVDARLLSFSQLAQEVLESQQDQARQYWLRAQKLRQTVWEQTSSRALHPDAILIPTQDLLCSTWPVVQCAIRHHWHLRGWAQQSMTRKHWERVRSYWASQSGTSPNTSAPNPLPIRHCRVTLPGSIRLDLRRGWLILQPPQTSTASQVD